MEPFRAGAIESTYASSLQKPSHMLTGNLQVGKSSYLSRPTRAATKTEAEIHICELTIIKPWRSTEYTRVSEALVNFEDLEIILSTSPVSWRQTFNSMRLDFGESNLQLDPRQHGEIRPRQAAASSTMNAAASSTSTSIAYPATPTSTATSVNVTENIGASYIDKAIVPPDSSLGPVSIGGSKM